MIAGIKRDAGTVKKLETLVDQAKKDARIAAGDETAAAEAKKAVRAAEDRLQSYLIDTRDFREDFPVHAAEIDLEGKRNAEGTYKRQQADKAKREALLKMYPTLRTEADGPEQFFTPPGNI
jgi:hypothetical protein